MPLPRPIPPGPGQESVWDYPRPPRLEWLDRPVWIDFAGVRIVEAKGCFRVLETSHPPTYYLPPGAIRAGVLVPASGSSICEWKGRARYFDIVAGDRTMPRGAWAYPDSTPAFAVMKDHVAFYAGPMDACWVAGERVTPQPGGFYGGWITREIVGPFKGEPGTMGW